MTKRLLQAAACALLAGVASLAVQAQALVQTPAMTPPHNVLTLDASAAVEVTTDWLTVVFSTTREGPEAGPVQSQLKQALDAALAEARKDARPEALEVQTGGFSLTPRYMPNGGINGWRGTAELIVQGRDTQAIAALTGRIKTLSIGRVGFSLSRQAREKVESEVMAMAIARFRARADEVARQFGFGGYTVREVTVSAAEPPMGVQPMMRAQAARAPMPDAPLAVEAGKAAVSASVSGSVQMK